MKNVFAFFKNPRTRKVVLILSMAVAGFWLLTNVIDVYRFAAVGAIYELLSITMLAMLVVIPIVSLFFLVKEKFNFRSLYLYSFLIVGATIVFIAVSN